MIVGKKVGGNSKLSGVSNQGGGQLIDWHV
jgi:hypothetical protein